MPRSGAGLGWDFVICILLFGSAAGMGHFFMPNSLHFDGGKNLQSLQAVSIIIVFFYLFRLNSPPFSICSSWAQPFLLLRSVTLTFEA